MSVKKAKGIVVKKATQERVKFSNDGTSVIGVDESDSHHIVGESTTQGQISVEGVLTLDDRLAGHLFSPPHVDGQTDEEQLTEFIDNASEYEGFMFYLKTPAPLEPFSVGEKFYFCENATWHPSPFTSEIVNNSPYLNPTYEIQQPALGQEATPFSLNLPADLFIDVDGDHLTYSATSLGGGELPAWLSFDKTNTILSGTPTEDDVGLVVLTITATDPGDLSASTSQEIQILVKQSPSEANPLLPTWTVLDNAPVFGLTNPAHGGAFVPQPSGGLNGNPTSWSSYTSAHTFTARSPDQVIDLVDAGTDKQLVMEYAYDAPTAACRNYMSVGLEGVNGNNMGWGMLYMVGKYDKHIWLHQNGTRKTDFHDLPYLNNSTEDITSFIFRIVMTPTHWHPNGNIRIVKVHFLGMRKSPDPNVPVLSWEQLRDGMNPAWSYYPHYVNYESQFVFGNEATSPTSLEFSPVLTVKSESSSDFSLEYLKLFFEDKG